MVCRHDPRISPEGGYLVRGCHKPFFPRVVEDIIARVGCRPPRSEVHAKRAPRTLLGRNLRPLDTGDQVDEMTYLFIVGG
ncbi:unnamed protein product [Chondrus crispus]|uniref:Uncharacterized protein n=1 Tax=Chondrus crispus TaxID=2769 RepID=R7Q549_CHOCR|nr:unnamed protein product [Chondrus crispus]CDF33682.1 unnamed protein product [Chondrus crispus]|eukprot:XP_005713501.1 unnamed protein product [Chondrus crispus]